MSGRAASTKIQVGDYALSVGMPEKLAPSGWTWVALEDLAEMATGHTPSRNHPEYWNGKHKWMCASDARFQHGGVVHETAENISQLGLENSAAVVLPIDTVCLARTGASIGYAVRLGAPMATNQGFVNWICGPNLDPKFYQFILVAEGNFLRRIAYGAAHHTIYFPEVKAFYACIPAITEQRRIVGLLDKAFLGIDTVKANTEKNSENARGIFESHLQSVFTQRRGGWIETTIGDQVTFQRGFDITKNQQSLGRVPVVSSGGIKSFHDTSMAKAPGVVIGRKGTLGKVFYLSESYWPHDTTLWIKDFKGNYPRFVYHFMRNLDVAHLDTGTANPALNRNVLHQIKINWPRVDIQPLLTAVFDALEINTERLASIYERKLAALDALKKSLLHRAFAGELTASKTSELIEAKA